MGVPAYTASELSPARWTVLTIILVVQIQLTLVMFAPSAVAGPIISTLQLSRTEFGLIMSALNISIAVCQPLGSLVLDRAGLKLGFFAGVSLTGLGAATVFGARSLTFLVFGRVLQGIGIGIIYPVLGALIMAWFPKREQPYVNTVFAVITYFGIGAGLLITDTLFRWFNGSWINALGCYGLSMIATALVWLAIGQDRRAIVQAAETRQMDDSSRAPGSLAKALGMPVAWTLALGSLAISYVYNMYFSFVPLYLESVRGMTQADANRLASLLPFSGAAGVVVFGLLAARPAWRKYLLCASCAVVILGSLPFLFGEGAVAKSGLIVAGVGLSGFLPVLNTYVMALPSMTPSLMAAFVVVVNVALYLGGFISPLAFGWASQTSLGLRNTLALFSWVDLLAILMFLRLPALAASDDSHFETTNQS